jgi:hypothetical protein
MRGGLVNIVDLEAVRIIARVSEQGMTPQVAWLEREGGSPLLAIATGSELNAFNIAPIDVNTESKSGD